MSKDIEQVVSQLFGGHATVDAVQVLVARGYTLNQSAQHLFHWRKALGKRAGVALRVTADETREFLSTRKPPTPLKPVVYLGDVVKPLRNALVTIPEKAPSPAASTALALHEVPFQGTKLAAVQRDGKVLVSIRRICDGIGLSYQAQLIALKSKPWATVAMIATVADDEKTREMAALDLANVPMWLGGINLAKIPNEHTRAKLAVFQRECHDVLAGHFGLSAPVAPKYEQASIELSAGALAQLNENNAKVALLEQRLGTFESQLLNFAGQINAGIAEAVAKAVSAAMRPVLVAPPLPPKVSVTEPVNAISMLDAKAASAAKDAYIATALGKQFLYRMKPDKVNKYLEKAKMQYKSGSTWHLTDLGKQHAVIRTLTTFTGFTHEGYIHWFPSVVPFVKALLEAEAQAGVRASA